MKKSKQNWTWDTNQGIYHWQITLCSPYFNIVIFLNHTADKIKLLKYDLWAIGIEEILEDKVICAKSRTVHESWYYD